MKIEKIDDFTYLVIGDFSSLDDFEISKDDLMVGSEKAVFFINQIKNDIIRIYNLNCDLVDKYTYVINNCCYIYFYVSDKSYEFRSYDDFRDFCRFIQSTKYGECFFVDENNEEIQVSSGVSREFFWLLEEFIG